MIVMSVVLTLKDVAHLLSKTDYLSKRVVKIEHNNR